MGLSTSSEPLQPLQTIIDPHFGQVELYKTSQIAHLMKKTFTFVQRSSHYKTLITNLKFMQQVRHSSLVPVHKLIHKQQKHLCIEYDVIEAYIEYYNFTLKNIIEAGRKLNKEELWYILMGLSDLAVLLKENNIKFKFEVDSIFISLSGIPCVYLIDGVCYFAEEDENGGEGMTQQRLEKENILSVSLADTILNLVEFDQSEDLQLESLNKIDENLYDLIKRMKKFEIELEEIPALIESLLVERKVQVSKTLSVTTKFMNQLKKQTTQNLTDSKQKERQKEKQKQKQKEDRQKQRQSQKQRLKEQQRQFEKQKQKMSLTLPSSNTISLQFPPKFLVMQQSLKGIDQKKRNNSQKQEIMKKRMEEMLSKQCNNQLGNQGRKQSGVKQKENANSTMKIVKGINSLSMSTVTSRQSLNNSQQIKPMRSSVLWRRKALELIKKEH